MLRQGGADVHHPAGAVPEIAELYETILRALDGRLTPTEAARAGDLHRAVHNC